MFGSWEGLFGGVSSLPKLPTWKINVCTAQSEEKHPKDYFQANISHQEGFLKESYLIYLIYHYEGCDYYSIGVQRDAVNFLYSNICWSDGQA